MPRAPKQTKAQALTIEQAQTFLEFAILERFRALWFVAIFTGCRPGELLGLEWKHINLEKAEIRVEQSLYRPKGGGWTITAPKTPKSRRSIPIPAGGELQGFACTRALLAAPAGQSRFRAEVINR